MVGTVPVRRIPAVGASATLRLVRPRNSAVGRNPCRPGARPRHPQRRSRRGLPHVSSHRAAAGAS